MPAAGRSAAAVLAAAGIMALAATACAQDLYRWTDADGKVHYSDHLPKGYNGPFTVIQPDMPATPTAPAMAPALARPPPPSDWDARPVAAAGPQAARRAAFPQALSTRANRAAVAVTARARARASSRSRQE